ncbi:MAG: hypothetical protein ACLQMF_05330 [Rectinemataceae bacterium]
MKTVIIDDIAFDPEVEGLKRGLHIEEGSEDERDFDRMLAEARSLARPKTIFGQAFVEPAGPDRVVVDGVEFKSRVLRVNLEGRRRSVVFAASSGMEMETWAASYASDDLMSYWADTVCEAALRCARERFGRTMKETMGFEKFSTMNPGSLEDWPVSQQIPLFSLLGDTKGAIGLELTDSLLMIPRKSVSGILFPVEESFESCQLCPREVCPNRRLPYNPGLLERKFAKVG